MTVDGPGRRSAAPAAAPVQVRLGLRENAGQFGLLVVVDAFVGAAIGVERTAVPLLAERAFGLTGAAVVASFVLAFGLAKALTNLAAGGLSTRLGRRRLLLLGWVIAVPVPLLLLGAQSWSWVLAANVLLGVSQGLTWSTTVVMKIDLVGPQRRGLALGLNEAAGYGAVAAAAYVAGVLAAEHGPRTAPFLLLAGLVAAGLLLSLGVRDTAEHVALKQAAHPPQTPTPLRAGTWGDRRLSAVSAAGLANNLNDAYTWALLPLLLLSRGLAATQTAAVAAVYPAVWGIGQLGTGALSAGSDGAHCCPPASRCRRCRSSPCCPTRASRRRWQPRPGSGAGTALVYPALLAAITDLVGPADRPAALGVYRLWRDLGNVAGALIAGGVSDLLGARPAIAVVAALTALTPAAGWRLHVALRHRPRADTGSPGEDAAARHR